MSGVLKPRAWTWRHAILESDLPATTRHVLLTISCFMNDVGEGCFRTTQEFSTWTGLSERSICTHIDRACRDGWLEKCKHGYRGQKWKTHEYRPSFPNDEIIPSNPKGTEGGSVPSGKKALNLTTKGTEPDDKKVLKEVQCDNILSESSHNSLNAGGPASGAPAPERKERDRSFDELNAQEQHKFDEPFWAAFKNYQRFNVVSKEPALREWRKLSAEQRARITVERVDAFQQYSKADGLSHYTAMAKVLNEGMLFTDPVEAILKRAAATEDDGTQLLKRFGSAWMIARLATLRMDPLPLSDKTRNQLENPDLKHMRHVFQRRAHHEKWPFVKRLDDGPIVKLKGDQVIADEHLSECVSVRVGSSDWIAWENYHHLKGWPFVEPKGGQEFVWFPADTPENWKWYQQPAQSAVTYESAE